MWKFPSIKTLRKINSWFHWISWGENWTKIWAWGFRWSHKCLWSTFSMLQNKHGMCKIVRRSHKILTQSRIHICHRWVTSPRSPQMIPSLLRELSHSWSLTAYQSHLQTSENDLNIQHTFWGIAGSFPQDCVILSNVSSGTKPKNPKPKEIQKNLQEWVKTGILTCLKNLLKHSEWSRLSRRLITLLVLLQHLVNLWIGCYGRPLARLRWLWRSSAKQVCTLIASPGNSPLRLNSCRARL